MQTRRRAVLGGSPQLLPPRLRCQQQCLPLRKAPADEC